MQWQGRVRYGQRSVGYAWWPAAGDVEKSGRVTVEPPTIWPAQLSPAESRSVARTS